MPDDKDYKLKVLVAWADIKLKVATLMLAANGAAFAAAFAFVKEKGPQSLGELPMKLAVAGLAFGLVALVFAWRYSERHLTAEFEVAAKPVQTKNLQKPLAQWQVNLHAKISTMKFANSCFGLCIFLSFLCLVVSVGYTFGVIDARRDFISKHPGSEQILNKW